MSASRSISALMLFGLTLIVAGALWRLFDEGVVDVVKEKYWIDGTAFLELMQIGNNVVPTVIMIVGVICLVLAGMSAYGGRRRVVEV